ncbi:MAG: hypothetical protein M1829_005287 [Trizodia sp. TS-e1964]|nr:MAG: hypothetical protein M1829_005287 [Trizodia sp. TS-e1964]
MFEIPQRAQGACQASRGWKAPGDLLVVEERIPSVGARRGNSAGRMLREAKGREKKVKQTRGENESHAESNAQDGSARPPSKLHDPLPVQCAHREGELVDAAECVVYWQPARQGRAAGLWAACLLLACYLFAGSAGSAGSACCACREWDDAEVTPLEPKGSDTITAQRRQNTEATKQHSNEALNRACPQPRTGTPKRQRVRTWPIQAVKQRTRKSIKPL